MNQSLQTLITPIRLPDRLNVNIGTIWRGARAANWIEPNRRIYDYELVYLVRGNCRVIVHNTTYPCRQGSVIIIPPGIIHCTIADSAVERWCIHFDWFGECQVHHHNEMQPYAFMSPLETFDQKLIAAPPPPELGLIFPLLCQFDTESNSFFWAHIQEIFMRTTTVGDMLKQRGLLLLIIAEILNAKNPHRMLNLHVNTRFVQAKSIFDAQFRESELQISNVAKSLSITPNHLTKLFRQELGISPIDYLHKLRFELSISMLETTSLNVQEIAQKSGFESSNYFSRIFRRKYGKSPTEFRQEFNANLI